MSENNDSLTLAEAAARLRVRPETARRWLVAGRLRGVRLGGTRAGWRIASSEIERFLREGEYPTIPPAPTDPPASTPSRAC